MSGTIDKDSLDSLLSSITDSIDSTSSVVDAIQDDFNLENRGIPSELVKSLLGTAGSSEASSLDSVSLLSLKNSALLGYITDLALLLAIRLKSIREDANSASYKEDQEVVLKSTVTNRVVLEKGIKSLEKKMSYQLEKMVNAFHRREKEQEDLEQKLKAKLEGNENAGEEDDEEEEEEEDDEEEEEEGLGFKPNPSALLKRGKPAYKKSLESKAKAEKENGEEEGGKKTTGEKYRPPKISATSISDPDKEIKGRKQRNLQSMDEYLQDISEAPSLEKSIGSTIINKGRDVKSKKQMEKEAEIQRYEEENFTRLPATKTKENKRERAKRMRNEFFGEDWSMFDNNMDVNSEGNNSKKRKRISAWERAKRKIDN